jgi:hypothetical protein
MTGHKKWSELAKPLRDDPVENYKSEEASRATRIILALADMRGLNCEPGEEPPPHDGALAEIIRIGEEDSLFLSYLGGYLKEMDGHLEVAAVFPDERVQLLG